MSQKRIAVPALLALALAAVALSLRGKGRLPATPDEAVNRLFQAAQRGDAPAYLATLDRHAPILLRVDAIADRRGSLRRQPAGIGGGHERVRRQPGRRILARPGRTRRRTGLRRPQRAPAVRPAPAERRLAGGRDRQGRYGQAAHPLRCAGIRGRTRRRRLAEGRDRVEVCPIGPLRPRRACRGGEGG